MRIAGMLVVALVVFHSATSLAGNGAAHRDRERPSERERDHPPPCKCARPKPIHAELVSRPRDTKHAEQVVSRVRYVYNRGIHACLGRSGITDAKLALTFARGATTPTVRATPVGTANTWTPKHTVRACLEGITFHGFTAPKRRTSFTLLVSTQIQPTAR